MMKYAKVMNIVGANEEDNNNYRGQLQQLPDEIIFYILSFLPLSSLLTFRCVCKLWNTLFLHPRLSFLHFLSSKFRGLDLDDVGSRDKEFDRSRRRHFSKIATTSQGLLELEAGRSVRVDGSRYRIRCPILRQHLHIPNPPPQNPSTRTSLCIALEFVPSTQAVKLVSVHEDDQYQYSLGYNVLALGVGSYRKSYCWRAIKVPPRNLPHRERAALRRMKLRLFFRMGVAYCISYVRKHGYDLDIEVDVLDMVNESYIGHTTFPRSGGFFSKMSSTTILDWNGLLSIAQLVKDELHVLVLHDYKRLKWDERKRIIKLPFLKPDHKELLTFSSCADNSKLYFVRQDDNPESLSHNTTPPLSQTSWDRLYESLLKSDHNELVTFSTFSDNSMLFCVRQDELESFYAITIPIARTSWEWLYELSLKPDLKEYFCIYDFNTGKLITVGSQKASRTDTVLQRNQLEIKRIRYMDGERHETNTVVLENKDILISKIVELARTMKEGRPSSIPPEEWYMALDITKITYLPQVEFMEMSKNINNDCYYMTWKRTQEELDSRIATLEVLRNYVEIKKMKYEAGATVDMCSICRKEFLEGSMVSCISSCSHVYHEACLLEWLLRNRSCPYCRSELTKKVWS